MPGHLVVYLAAAPGAGKTRKLEDDARHLREHGKRVSIGIPPGDVATLTEHFDAVIIDGLETSWREAAELRNAGLLVFGALDVDHIERTVPNSFLREADEVVAIDASLRLLRARNPALSDDELQARRRSMLRIIDDLTLPAVARERVSIAAVIVPHDLTEPDAYLRRVEAITAGLDLALDVVDISAPHDVDELRASLVAVPHGPQAARIVNRPVVRDVFIVSREQTYLADPPLSPHPLGTTVGDRLQTNYGKLTIYLGAGPGTGKTIAMLDRGRQLVADGRTVLAVGVATQDRPRTIEALAQLEHLPEFDRDVILAREPQVLLIDSLCERFRDTVAMLRSGVDVVATLDVQNVGSLGDAVARLTGAAMRERGFTVDSEVFQGLRELAVREVLLSGNREERTAPFDRLLLSVAARIDDLPLIKRCSRIAARLHAGFSVACASKPDANEEAAVARLRAETRAYGGIWIPVEGEDIPRALLAKARQIAETTLAVGGTLRTPRWPQPNSFAYRLLDAGARELFVLARR